MSETVFSWIPSTKPCHVIIVIIQRDARVVMIPIISLVLKENFCVRKSTPTCPFTCWVYAAPSRIIMDSKYSDSSRVPGIGLLKMPYSIHPL
jgi:hypothetical protein